MTDQGRSGGKPHDEPLPPERLTVHVERPEKTLERLRAFKGLLAHKRGLNLEELAREGKRVVPLGDGDPKRNWGDDGCGQDGTV